MHFNQTSRRILGKSDAGANVPSAYGRALEELRTGADYMQLLADIAPLPKDNRWIQRGLAPHEAALIYAFLANDKPRFRGNCTRLDAAFVHLLPFLALSEGDGLAALRLYVTWRESPLELNVGTLAELIRQGLIAMTFDDTDLLEFLLYSYWVEFWLNSVAHEGWGRMLPLNTAWGHFFQDSFGRIQVLGRTEL